MCLRDTRLAQIFSAEHCPRDHMCPKRDVVAVIACAHSANLIRARHDTTRHTHPDDSSTQLEQTPNAQHII